MDANAVSFMPMDAAFRIMAVSLNASKSLETDIVVGLHLNEDIGGKKGLQSGTEPEYYALHVRRGILEVNAECHGNGQSLIITTDALTWKNLVLGKINPQDAVADGLVDIGGADQAFYDFMDLFN